MIGRCDASAALTGHCDVRAALFGCRGGETHARSAAWSYGTDRDGTSAGAGEGDRKPREEDSEERVKERLLGKGEGVRGKKERKSEMSSSVNNMEQALNGSCDQRTCTAATLYGDMSM